MREYFHRSHEMKFGGGREAPHGSDPDKVAADRVAIEKLLTRAHGHGPDGWWNGGRRADRTALHADPPDFAAAKRGWHGALAD